MTATNPMDPTRHLRDDLLKLIFRAAAILGLVALLLSIWRGLLLDWHPLIFLNGASFVCILLGNFFESRWPFSVRAALLLAVAFALGTSGLLTWGLMPVGILGIFAFCILTTLLLGRRAGIGATAIAVIVMAMIGLSVHHGVIAFHFDAQRYVTAGISWIQAISGLLLSAGIIVMAVGKLHQQFVGMIHRLDHQNLQLRESNAMLATEIEEHARVEKERQVLADRLRLAQKMEALGLLSGSVAHDLNNVLMGVVSYPDLLLRQLPEDSPLRQPMATIKSSGLKAAAMAQDMLALARRGVAVEDTVNLNGIVGELMESPELAKIKKFHGNVTITASLGHDLDPIKGSRFHLLRVVTNLVSNAAEAMNEGGSLSIRTENRSVETPIHGFETIPPGRYAALIVQDTGIGIDTEEIARIFEPFFTKKKMGRSGTGLGMAVVWSVVKDHGGFIEVLSQKGVGTRFEVYWPATVAAPAEGDTPALRDYPGKGESILVVDDAPEMREIACHMITALGYQAVAVPNGDAAVRYLTGQPMDLVVLDMVMDPGMDGLETFKRILTVRPGQKVIITSGFAETDRVATARTMGVLAYLKKPYLVEELARTIRIALDSSIPAGPD